MSDISGEILYYLSSCSGKRSADSIDFDDFIKSLLPKHTHYPCSKSFVKSGLDPYQYLQHYGYQTLQSSPLGLKAISLTLYVCPWVDVGFNLKQMITQLN